MEIRKIKLGKDITSETPLKIIVTSNPDINDTRYPISGKKVIILVDKMKEVDNFQIMYGMWFHRTRNYLELPDYVKAELILRGVSLGKDTIFLLDKDAYDADTRYL